MRRLLLSVSICSALVLSASAATAAPKKVKLSLKQKRIVKGEEKDLAEDLVSLNKKCGSKIKASIDWASFKKADAINKTTASPCENILGDLEHVCRDADGKEAIQEGVKEIKCVWSPQKEAKHSLEKGVLTEHVWVDAKGGSYFTANPKISSWIAENL